MCTPNVNMLQLLCRAFVGKILATPLNSLCIYSDVKSRFTVASHEWPTDSVPLSFSSFCLSYRPAFNYALFLWYTLELVLLLQSNV